MENQLLSAAMLSRESYDLISGYIELKLPTYSKQFQVLMNKIGEYYKRDEAVESVDATLLMGQIAETIRNDKHIGMFQAKIDDALTTQVSEENVRALILTAKQQEVGDKLSQALVTDASQGKVDELLEELRTLRMMTSLADLDDEEIRVLTDVEVMGLISRELDPESLIKVYPQALNDRLDGGVKRGHHITIFARPEVGKTATCVNMSCGFLVQNLRVLYLINEDREEDIMLRHVFCLSGMDKWSVSGDPQRAEELARKRGYANLVVVSIAPGTPKQIEELIDTYKPDVVFVDQLRNLQVRADNRVNQLEYAATAVRNIGKKKSVVMISVTQAGDSADGKAVLEMGDVDYSNTGIPAQADVLLGIGMDATLEAEGRRMMSLCKNKLSGRHEAFPVSITPALSRVGNV